MTAGLSAQEIIEGYVEDLVRASETRAFPPVIQKWYTPDAKLFFRHETEGRENSKRVWTFLLPTGEDTTREVHQYPYKLEGRRLFSWRVLSGGNVPQPIYNLQETLFDDHTLIEEMVIRSAQEKPEVETDPEAEKSRLGRIFLAFVGMFNEYFATGDDSLFDDWLADNARMIVENNLTGMGMVQHFARISVGSVIELQDWEQVADDRIKADISIARKGEPFGVLRSEFVLTPEGKFSESKLLLESGEAVRAG